jgi:hypothetical protein
MIPEGGSADDERKAGFVRYLRFFVIIAEDIVWVDE